MIVSIINLVSVTADTAVAAAVAVRHQKQTLTNKRTENVLFLICSVVTVYFICLLKKKI